VLTWRHQLADGSRDLRLDAKRCLGVQTGYRRGSYAVGVISGSAFDTTVHSVTYLTVTYCRLAEQLIGAASTSTAGLLYHVSFFYRANIYVERRISTICRRSVRLSV